MGFLNTKFTSMAIERRYSDDSGVEFGVKCDGEKIVIEHINEVSFPVEELRWLISALEAIRDELTIE